MYVSSCIRCVELNRIMDICKRYCVKVKDLYVWFNVEMGICIEEWIYVEVKRQIYIYEMGTCIEEWIYVSIDICRGEETDIYKRWVDV